MRLGLHRLFDWLFCMAAGHSWNYTRVGRYCQYCWRTEIWVPRKGPDDGQWEKRDET